jgi:acyl-CoA synthetase (NDP forming)/RimJ/RimL family protein N-acetyltransferase
VSDAPPPHWEFDVVLNDGGTVHIRPLLPGDREAYLRFFHGLSAETRYYRFFSPKSTLTDDEVTYFTTVDHADRVALAAFEGADMVAVARYDRLVEDGRPGPDAEVAFTIDDAHQGRGLGALMLEYLAAAGREHGVTRFVAETIPDNRRMLAVFHAAGYHSVNRFSGGMVEVEFRIDDTDDARAVVERREHRAEAASVRRILRPGSVVVIGDLSSPGSTGSVVATNLLDGGFEGPVRLVDPAARAGRSFAGREVLASLHDVDVDVELAIVTVAAPEAIGLVEACAAKGAQGLVVMSTGFRDAGAEGMRRERELLRAARRAGIRLVGPGSLGILDTEHRLFATTTAERPARGRVAMMSESAAVGAALLEWAAWRGVGVSSFVSAGDKADVSGNDLLQYWEEDPGTDVVLLYLESFGNPRKFARLARRVARTTPVVAVRPGRDPAVDALFRQAGVVRVESVPELFDVAALLVGPAPAGPRVAVVSGAHGPGLLALDAARAVGLEAAPVSSATVLPAPEVPTGRRAPVEGLVEVSPPTPERWAAALDAVLGDPGVDVVHVVTVSDDAPAAEQVAAEIEARIAAAAVPVVVSRLSPGLPPAALRGGSVRVFDTAHAASLALARTVDHAEWRRLADAVETSSGSLGDVGVDPGAARRVVDGALVAGDGVAELDEATAGALLAAYGIDLPRRAGRPDAVGVVPGAPLAVDIDHDESFGALLRLDLAASIRLSDAPVVRLAPLAVAEAEAMVAALGSGARGSDDASTAALVELLVRLGRLAADLPEVEHLCIDPLLVDAEGLLGVPAVHLRAVPPEPPDLVRRLRT